MSVEAPLAPPTHKIDSGRPEYTLEQYTADAAWRISRFYDPNDIYHGNVGRIVTDRLAQLPGSEIDTQTVVARELLHLDVPADHIARLIGCNLDEVAAIEAELDTEIDRMLDTCEAVVHSRQLPVVDDADRFETIAFVLMCAGHDNQQRAMGGPYARHPARAGQLHEQVVGRATSRDRNRQGLTYLHDVWEDAIPSRCSESFAAQTSDGSLPGCVMSPRIMRYMTEWFGDAANSTANARTLILVTKTRGLDGEKIDQIHYDEALKMCEDATLIKACDRRDNQREPRSFSVLFRKELKRSGDRRTLRNMGRAALVAVKKIVESRSEYRHSQLVSQLAARGNMVCRLAEIDNARLSRHVIQEINGTNFEAIAAAVKGHFSNRYSPEAQSHPELEPAPALCIA